LIFERWELTKLPSYSKLFIDGSAILICFGYIKRPSSFRRIAQFGRGIGEIKIYLAKDIHSIYK